MGYSRRTSLSYPLPSINPIPSPSQPNNLIILIKWPCAVHKSSRLPSLPSPNNVPPQTPKMGKSESEHDARYHRYSVLVRALYY